MAYTAIKNCKMDWETETHTFTFVSCGDRLSALDSLGDIKGSLEALYDKICEDYDWSEESEANFPREFKVRGDCCFTTINGERV